MKIKKISLFALILTLSFTLGCTKIITLSKKSNQKQANNSSRQTIDPIKQKLDHMTLDEKIGQLVIVGIDDYTNNEHSKTLINTYHVGGFILFGQNIKNSAQLLELINSLKETNSSNNKTPLLLGVDEEGGRVSRMPSEFVKLPSNAAVGHVNNSNFSYKIGEILGQELKGFGLNVDFAPVLDVNSNRKNPVIGDRSFGSNPPLVSNLGIQTMKGIQSQNIISVVKHFPGHGDTLVDSHFGLPIVYNDIKRLNNLELVPFSNAIKHGVDMIMVAHILLPKIDLNNPASFSKTIITDILRKRMNFNGVVITDDMTMGAIIKKYDIGEASIKSLNAGSDIILVCHDFDKEVTVLNAIKNSVTKGTLPEKTINEKVYRILKLKEKYNLKDTKTTSINIQVINNKINNLLDSYMR
ncbi:beta-N-acetylhexosaminidase [Clostridium neuense]|uniref:beta-N-acetylhexosaminidase n=1 Tax=Clostridium neuense TaxID=1728934 RepID=A0ABW8THL9_9CLOT